MRITRKQSHIILALVALCHNKVISSEAVQCKTANDINPPTCDIFDLNDDVLIDICKRAGYQHKRNPSREQLLIAAEICLDIDKIDRLGLPYQSSQRLIVKHIDEAMENEARGQHLFLDYLGMMKDTSFVSRSRHDRISYLLSKHGVDDVEEKAFMRELLLEKLGGDDDDLEEQTPNFGLTPEEITKLPKWSSRWNLTGLKEGHRKAFQKDGIVVASKWNAASKTWYKSIQLTESMDADDFVRKSIHYDHVLRVQSEGGVILIGYNNGDDPLDTAQAVIVEHMLDWKYFDRLVDSIRQYIGESHPLSYIVSGAGSKHINGRYDLSIQNNGELWYQKQIPATESDPEWAGKKLTILRCNFVDWSISEVDIKQPCTDKDIDYYKNESGDRIIPRLVGWLTVIGIDPPPLLAIGSSSSEEESNQPTPEEIAMLPEWNPNNLPVGLQRGQMKLYRIGGQVVISRWSDQTWSQPIVFSNRLDSESVDLLKKSIQYEYTPQYPLKLKEGGSKILIIGYNYGDDPFVIAQRVIDEYSLDAGHKDNFVRFVREIEQVVQHQRTPGNEGIIYQIFQSKPTSEEIVKLPDWKEQNTMIGFEEGYVRAFNREGKVVTAKWSAISRTWSKPMEITELDYKNGHVHGWDGINALEFVRKSIQYNYVSVFQTGIHKKVFLVGYNYGDDPLAAAQSAIDEHELDKMYLKSITDLFRNAEDIIKQKSGLPPSNMKMLRSLLQLEKELSSPEEKDVTSEWLALEDYTPTPKEIAKLPHWHPFLYPGVGDELKLFQKDGKVVTSCMSKIEP